MQWDDERGGEKKNIAAYQSYDPGFKVRPRAGCGDGGGGASAVRLLAAPNLLARGPTMDPVHVAALAVEPQGMSRFEGPQFLDPRDDPNGNGPVNPQSIPIFPKGRVLWAAHAQLSTAMRLLLNVPVEVHLKSVWVKDMTRCQPIEVGSLPAEIREPILTCLVFSEHIWAKN